MKEKIIFVKDNPDYCLAEHAAPRCKISQTSVNGVNALRINDRSTFAEYRRLQTVIKKSRNERTRRRLHNKCVQRGLSKVGIFIVENIEAIDEIKRGDLHKFDVLVVGEPRDDKPTVSPTYFFFGPTEKQILEIIETMKDVHGVAVFQRK